MDSRKMMGLDSPGDQKVPVPIRNWNAMKLALWRSKVGWQIVARTAISLVSRAQHAEGCPGKDLETEPCLPGCPDRELRMDALVILSAARMFAPVDAKKIANEPYFAPSREYFSELVAALAAEQAENAGLREALRRAGVEPPAPPPNAALPAQHAPAQLGEKSS